MEEGRPSFGYSGGGSERRLEVVSGKNFNAANEMYQSDPPPISFWVTRLSRSTAPAAVAVKPWGFTDGEMKRRK
ncbi:hypothetical protein Vadar_013925 [Vaccinium darrowii]|uniref:Uncharacterized protein n=1 Tax=Vaccinium darrowii TaxID=229202 RepID=A0ACB7ZCI3_9ERIC|nr:hypothetical protein Vadar_013925 [Vaccinium darrowii]